MSLGYERPIVFCRIGKNNVYGGNDMPQSKGPFYMTTAIAYTSGKPHIGNTYEIVLADAIARYKRSQ